MRATPPNEAIHYVRERVLLGLPPRLSQLPAYGFKALQDVLPAMPLREESLGERSQLCE